MNFQSLVPARLHRIEGSRTEFSITSLRVRVRWCAEIPAGAPIYLDILVTDELLSILLYSSTIAEQSPMLKDRPQLIYRPNRI
jgi:hypothetical protein